jgi:hypothetical protein
MDDHSKSLEDFEIEIMSKIVSEDMVKEDNIECCVCMEFHWGVKLPNCNHFICSKCYYNLYYGYVSDIFYTNNPIPIYPKKPTYPYVNTSKNLEIYNNLIEDENIKLYDELIREGTIHLELLCKKYGVDYSF